MTDDSQRGPEDEFREMLRQFLSGDSEIDPAQLAGVAGLPDDPAFMARLMSQLQNAVDSSGDGIDWKVATEQAVAAGSRSAVETPAADRAALEQAFHVAALWLDDVTFVSELTVAPRLVTRAEWSRLTMPVWSQLAEPVASSIADSLTGVLRDQAPEEMQSLLAGASQVMRSVGGTLFAMQLGQVVGQLSLEVVSGGDVGIPLLDDQQAAILPQNVAAFGEGLDIETDQIQIYLAVRELAHARLFRHARWLRLHLISSIREFAQGISIDTERLEALAVDFDPSSPDELRDAMASGALIPPKSDEQLAALARLETMLALIEGWVDVVTAEATARLPRSGAIAETVRRRRAAGGPAESAFSTLVGLELRPRRLREAAAMWSAITEAVGAERRDSLWSHPDIVPSSEDIDDPQGLIARLTDAEPALDDVDRAIAELLDDTSGDRPHEGGDGAAGEPGSSPER
ncbi:zinc-dependent metalloprotease [Frigoribacterium sp. CFBP9039]|uniref:zinc-dependent metalloprotease n=1 Tax=unclassified Frigoribacterium TaxID=2627005 RepID=UPI001786CEDF|nr:MULTISPECIES: zinc-dependent metalloprotease [unclassified Frigoribacterium]MBD8703090.1 zinc-dependent metalloprotease [Frigoribacterium sp. CFBP 13712]MDY0890528.1 zinc-dependent metalloprotease [Frigoribacterium sp. CFBP9030]MDY0944654.1 zinc-dependent metalloprotease [Frigoribacterium sp. CFBP9039]